MIEILSSIAAPVLFALLCWWFGTGVILWLVRRPASSFGWSLAVVSVLLVLSVWTSFQSMQSASVANAYLAFASVIVMWSWHELAFLTGWLAGPRRVALTAGVQGRARLNQSVQAVLYHELALLLNFLVLLWLQQGQPGHVAICTFALLWCMRFTAKMNLFLGVPEVGEQYLPAHLVYLASYFRRAPVTLFFYATIGLAVATWLWMVWRLLEGSVLVSTGWVLLAALLGLAIVEHVFMAFPVPMQRLWGWAMAKRNATERVAPPLIQGTSLPARPISANADNA
jgi:putative photosynthetic complex assembly protein 2